MNATEQFTLPQVGIGTYRLSPADAERSVAHALKTGYHLVDTANIYMNEKAVGRALATADIPPYRYHADHEALAERLRV